MGAPPPSGVGGVAVAILKQKKLYEGQKDRTMSMGMAVPHSTTMNVGAIKY